MWNFVAPALTAIGINSGINLLRRKPLLQNAGTAGVTGGILGGFNDGGLFSSNPTAVATSAPTTAGAFEASMNLPQSSLYEAAVGGTKIAGNAPAALIGSTGEIAPNMGLVNTLQQNAASQGLTGMAGANTIGSMGMQFNPATGTYINPEYYANVLGTPTYTGGEGLLSNAMSNISDQFSDLGEYVTPKNLLGVSMLLNNMSDMPRPVATSGGGMQGGTPPKFEPFVTGKVYERKRRG